MSAHDELERQLRASVAQAASRVPALRLRARLWSRGPSALIVAASTAVALGVALVALVAFHHGRPPSSQPAAPAVTHDRSRFGPRPRDPGPIPRNVDDAAVAAAWNTAWREDPICNPGPGPAAASRLSYGTPSAAMLSTIPALRGPATTADRLPASFYVHGRLQAFTLGSGEPYARFIRRARVTDGITVYLVPAAKLGRPPLSPALANRCYELTVAALRAELPTVPPAKRAATRRYGDAEFALGRYNLETSSIHEGVSLITTLADAARTDGGQSVSTIRQTGMLSEGGQVTENSPTVLDGIVPGGVATVTLRFPAIHHASQRLPPLNATGAVINNVFVIPVPTLFQRGGWPASAIWRSASGQVVKTINEAPFHP
jgi:hypothetical protein